MSFFQDDNSWDGANRDPNGRRKILAGNSLVFYVNLYIENVLGIFTNDFSPERPKTTTFAVGSGKRVFLSEIFVLEKGDREPCLVSQLQLFQEQC